MAAAWGGGSGLQGNEKFVDLRFLKICKLFIQILFHLKLQKFVVGDFYVCFFFVFKFFFLFFDSNYVSILITLITYTYIIYIYIIY